MKTHAHRDARVLIPPGSRVFCISHKDDADGLASAALIYRATRCSFSLTGYDDLDEVLTEVPRDLDWLVLADLGLSEKEELINSLQAMARHVLYVDHHLLSSESKRMLRRARVIVRHSLDNCASVQAWDVFRHQLPQGALNLAAYGVVTDPPVSGRLTREVLMKTHWNLNGYEGHLLALALSSKKCTAELRRKIVTDLAALRMPHEMGPVRRLADQQASAIPEIRKRLYNQAKVKGRVAIVQEGHLGLGTTAELLLGYPNVTVTLAYHTRGTPSQTRISVRGTDECRKHLGKILSQHSRKVGGEGGGHMLAAGAMVPTKRLHEFIRRFAKEVSN
jgi:nanoRNase/pAp phosphatase (c-di-AMP/oligoRNAs hydrolase)